MRRANCKGILRGTVLMLAVILILSGCQRTVPEENAGGSMREEGPLTEYSIPEWETFMHDLAGTDQISPQGVPVLCRGSVSQMVVAIREVPNDFNAYHLIFSSESGQWIPICMQDAFEREGIRYSHIGATFPSLSGGQYCVVYTEEGKGTLAALGADGVGEIYADRQWPDQIKGDHMLLDASDHLVTWQNNGLQYGQEYSADVYSYGENLREQGQQHIEGWVLGGLQADVQAPFYWYGYDMEKQPCLWEKDGSKRLLEGVKELDYQAAYGEDGVLYITDRNGIWEMDGARAREIYHYGEHGYYPSAIYGMCRGEGQTLHILMECQEELLFLVFDLNRKDVATDKQEITLALGIRNAGLEEVIARFNRQSSQYRVKVTFPGSLEETEDFLRNIQMELSAGRGPDLLGDGVLTDLDSLVDGGYLVCLDGQGFEKLGCIETALETNRIGSKLYGIPYDFSFDTAFYRAADMEGVKSLTLTEFMARVRGSQAKSVQEGLYPIYIVTQYALSDSSNRVYIDWETGESHLDGQPFLELLEFAREYGYQNEVSETGEMFAAPNYIRSAPAISSLSGMAEIYTALGTTDVAALGYPREEGYGIYMNTRNIYVNSRSAEKEGAAEFLRYLLSEQAQTIYVSHDAWKDMDGAGGSAIVYITSAQLPVNRAALEALMDKEFGEKPEDQWIGDQSRSLTVLEKQREQFNFLLENARPAFDLGELETILQEELAPYFDGTRTAQETAGTLNSRVQLYLDERK